MDCLVGCGIWKFCMPLLLFLHSLDVANDYFMCLFHRVFEKSLQYVKRFSRYKNPDAVRQVREYPLKFWNDKLTLFLSICAHIFLLLYASFVGSPWLLSITIFWEFIIARTLSAILFCLHQFTVGLRCWLTSADLGWRESWTYCDLLLWDLNRADGIAFSTITISSYDIL